MKRIIAKIHLLTTAEGGRKGPILVGPQKYGCPVFFKDIPELSKHGYDCRLLMTEYGKPIAPGETAEELEMIFLSADEVLPHMKPGVEFTLWEGKTVGHGTVVKTVE